MVGSRERWELNRCFDVARTRCQRNSFAAQFLGPTVDPMSAENAREEDHSQTRVPDYDAANPKQIAKAQADIHGPCLFAAGENTCDQKWSSSHRKHAEPKQEHLDRTFCDDPGHYDPHSNRENADHGP